MRARSTDGGSGIVLPAASRQTAGAKKSWPSGARRARIHGARRAPGGTTTHAPLTQLKRSPAHSQPPSTQSGRGSPDGRSGTISMGAVRGAKGTST